MIFSYPTKTMKRRLMFLTVIFFAFGLLSAQSLACTCTPITLKTRFEITDNIFIGKITASELIDGKSMSEQPDSPEGHHYFEVTERFKGDLPFPYLVGELWSSCSTNVTVGETYLFFTSDDGSISDCNAPAILHSNDTKKRTEQLVEILRRHAQKLGDLSEPWHVTIHENYCAIGTGFEVDGLPYYEQRGSIRLSYSSRTPTEKRELKLQLIWPTRIKNIGPFVLEADDLVYRLDKSFPEKHNKAVYTTGQDKLDFVSKLKGTRSIKVTNLNPSSAGSAEVDIPLGNLGNAADEFLNCYNILKRTKSSQSVSTSN